MRILALDSALARCSVGLVVDGRLVATRSEVAGHGQAARLPAMTAALLTEAGLPGASLDLVAVIIGPGSFTGIRAALSLAHGLALGSGIPATAVTVGEALAASLPHLGGRAFWSAVDSRRGRVFLERDGAIAAYRLDDLPAAPHRTAVAGDAAIEVAARLAALGADVMLTDARLPQARYVAEAAMARWEGRLAPLAVQPVYVDPPEARLPAGGLRPPPIPT